MLQRKLQNSIAWIHISIIVVLCHNLLLSSFLANYGFSQPCPFQIREVAWSTAFRLGMMALDLVQLITLVVYLSSDFDYTVLVTVLYSLMLVPTLYLALQEDSIWYYYPCLCIIVAFCLLTLKLVLRYLHERKGNTITRTTTSTTQT